jgi:outer membrane lipoprotein-sorting protein
MRTKVTIFVIVGLLAAAGLIAGIVAAAGAGTANPLPTVSASDLLAKMAQQDQKATSISGDVSWQNNLLGDLSALTGGNMGGSAQLPLAANGSGRIRMSAGGARIESQASGGDQSIVMNGAARDAWIYDYAANTAKHIVMTGTPPAGSTAPSPLPSPTMAAPAAISTFLQQLAPNANVSVTGQGVVAGREVYFLTMTPAATDTALGSVQAAIDGQTYVPLQLQVTARGGTSPVLEFGFTSVSYAAVAASTYDFTPPPGTTVTTKTIDLSKATQGQSGPASGQKAEPTKAQQAKVRSLMQSALLTVPEAQKLVPFQLASAQGYTARPFQWAAVIDKGGPLNALNQPIMQLLGASGMGGLGGSGSSTDPGAGATSSATSTMGPTAVLLYGKGFGTIALAETATTPALQKQLAQLPALVDKTSMNGATVRSFTTPLGGVFVWQQGGTTLVAAGMVPAADLQAFVSTVH